MRWCKRMQRQRWTTMSMSPYTLPSPGVREAYNNPLKSNEMEFLGPFMEAKASLKLKRVVIAWCQMLRILDLRRTLRRSMSLWLMWLYLILMAWQLVGWACTARISLSHRLSLYRYQTWMFHCTLIVYAMYAMGG